MKTPEFSDVRAYAFGARAGAVRRRRPRRPTSRDLAAMAGLPEPVVDRPRRDPGPPDDENLTALAARLSSLLA